jgi:hypothetical protein
MFLWKTNKNRRKENCRKTKDNCKGEICKIVPLIDLEDYNRLIEEYIKSHEVGHRAERFSVSLAAILYIYKSWKWEETVWVLSSFCSYIHHNNKHKIMPHKSSVNGTKYERECRNKSYKNSCNYVETMI